MKLRTSILPTLVLLSQVASPFGLRADEARESLFRSLAKDAARMAVGHRGIQRRPLKDCVKIALEKNLLLQAAVGKVDVARALRDQARAAYVGKVELQAGRTRFNDDLFAFVQKRYATSKGLLLDQPLWYGGRLRLGVRAARQGEEAASFEEEGLRQEVLYQVTEAYFAVLRTEKLLALAMERLASVRARLEVVRARVDQGAAVRSEQLRVEVEESGAREDVIRMRNGRRRALAALNLVMGTNLNDEFFGVDEWSVRAFGESLEAGFVRAYGHRPDLQALEAALRVKATMVASARAQHKPNLHLSASYGDRDPVFAGDQDSLMATMSFSMKLFDGGSVSAEVRKARAEHAEMKARYDFAVQRALLEVKQAYLDVLEGYERLGVFVKSVAQAEEHLRLTMERYRSGASILLETVDAELLVNKTKAAAIAALYDYNLARASYYRATGAIDRLWEPEAAAGSDG